MAIPHPLKNEYKIIFDAIDDDINLLKSFLNHVEENENNLGRKPNQHPQHIFYSKRLLWLEDMRKELKRFVENPEYKLNLGTIVGYSRLGYPNIDLGIVT